MARPRILAFDGSLRKDSYNRKLVAIAARGAERAGAEVTRFKLSDLPLPLFSEDLEREGTPENARKLKELMRSHDAFLISCPEYNSSITGALKNAIDWASRPAPNEPSLVAFDGKVAGLLAASPGALGGLRGLVHVRAILGNIRVLLIPDQLAVSRAHEAFDEQGELRDEAQRKAAEAIGARVAEVAKRMANSK